MDKTIRWLRESKAIFHLTAAGFIIAGASYMIFPPRTTTRFFDGDWPPILWGAMMLIGGVLEIIGLRTRILNWSVLGLTFLWAGTGSLALAQTMVMIAPPPTLTRGGGTALYWILMALVVARLIIVSADKRDGKYAQDQIDERD